MISSKPVPQNACFSIRDNFDPNSIVIEESELHQEKHPSPKTSTDEGSTIASKPILLNAFSIRDNLDSDSNVTEESDLQSEKHFSPKNTTESGMIKNRRSVFSNASDSIRSNSDLFSITAD
jgi:hypothetical protein